MVIKTKILTFSGASVMILTLAALSAFLALTKMATAAGPTANAGPDREVMEGELVKLKGSGTGEELTYFWSCNGGSLSNAHIAQPNYIAPRVKQDTHFICNLIVSDNQGFSATDSTTVFVKNSSEIASFSVAKTVRNVSKGHRAWYKSVGAKPGDKLVFQIMITATGNKASQDIKVKDALPANLIYQGDLKVDGVAKEGNITRETIEIESIRFGQSKRITFAAKVAAEEKFKKANTNLINTAVAYNIENSDTDTCRIAVVKEARAAVSGEDKDKGISGVSTVSTGVASAMLTSILFPLALALLIVWIFKSEIIGLDMIFEQRKKQVAEYRAKKKLKKLIARFNDKK